MPGFEQLAGVVLFIGMLLAVLWAVRSKKQFFTARLGRATGAPKRMALLERLPLTQHHTLHLVSVGDRQILLLTSAASSQVLDLAGAGIGENSGPDSQPRMGTVA